MSMGGPRPGEGEGATLFTEMNVTPLTDVFLVLLIIFMVTASGLTASSLDVALPKAATPGSVDAEAVVVVSVDARARMFVGTDEVAAADVEARLRDALAKSKERSVILAGDKGVPLDRVVLVMEAARKAGAKRFAIAVAREDAGRETAIEAAHGR